MKVPRSSWVLKVTFGDISAPVSALAKTSKLSCFPRLDPTEPVRLGYAEGVPGGLHWLGCGRGIRTPDLQVMSLTS